MDTLAKYMGLVEAINHTGKPAYFKPYRNGSLKFICNKRDFDPRTNIDMAMTLMDIVVESGAEITIHYKVQKNSAHVRYEAVMEINKQIYRAIGISCQPAIVNCIRKYTENLERHYNLETHK